MIIDLMLSLAAVALGIGAALVLEHGLMPKVGL